MIVRKTDIDGDFTFGTGEDFLRNTPEAVGQNVVTRLKLWKGEWFTDVSDGTDWEMGVLGKRTTNPDTLIQGRILGTEGVVNIEEYASVYDGNNRKHSISVTINTIYGLATIQETL